MPAGLAPPGVVILNAEPEGYCAAARSILRGCGELVEADCGDRAALLRRIGAVDVLITRLRHRIDDEMLAAAPRLRIVATATTGLDHLDLAAARRRGVEVVSLRGQTRFLRTVTSTPEHTWALLLALCRRLAPAMRDVLDGGWERDRFRGRQLSGLRLGIVGFGRVGRIVADYARAFRMSVSAFDPAGRRAPRWVSLEPLPRLLAGSDAVVLAARADEGAPPILGADEFASFKPGALFVNTARGRLADERALLEALSSGRLAGAALDVLAGEHSGDPDWLAREPLLAYARTHDNLLLTPHIAGATTDAMAATEVFIAREIARRLGRTVDDG